MNSFNAKLGQDNNNNNSHLEESRKKSQRKKLWMKLVDANGFKNNKSPYELTLEDLKYNLCCAKLLTVIKILPCEMDVETGIMEIKYKNSSTSHTFKTKFLTTVWSLFAVGRICSLVFDSVYLVSSEGDEMESNGMKMLRKVFTVFATFVCIGLYDGYRDAVLAYMPTMNILSNSLFQNIKRRKNHHSHLGLARQFKDMVKSLVRRPFRVNLLIHLPLLVYTLILVIPGVMILDPKSPILLSSHSLATKEREFSLLLYLCLATLDMIFWSFIFSLIYYAVFYMLLFMVWIDQESKSTIKKLSRPDGLGAAVRSLQLIKLQILVFNLRVSNIVYLTKLIALAAAITGGFLMIKLMHSNPLFALPFLLCFLEGNILYIVLFNNVYEITRNIEVLKEEILIRVQIQNHRALNTLEKEKEEYKRICGSIQRLGIQAGGFSFMEREATLTFGDYSTQQIVSLLLTFS